ncbi:MAG: hypothetical protein B7Y41_06250 [Hydrogenophilales bacterium 28-61-23]|nr:MAG: hypothetical protein B7Y41_06250 [Hydrogenophilales bacterium 28-61-23]
MTVLRLPFAIRLSDNQLVSAVEVPRGAACNCICPGCRNPLLARQGTEREWHFAHVHASDCADGYEKSVHELAKQRIQQQKLLLLPAIEVSAQGWDAYGRLVEEKQLVMEARSVSLDDCKKSLPHGVVTPDLTGRRQDREILVEITVFHRLMPDKQARLVETGVPSFEINLGVFQIQQATLERLDAELFENPKNRLWIWHPKQEAAQTTVEAAVEARISAVRMQWEAEERLRPPPVPRPAAPVYSMWRQREEALPPQPQRTPFDSRRWRAGLPMPEQVALAAYALSGRTGVPATEVLSLTGALTSRGMLVEVTPTELAARWAQQLQVPEHEMVMFLIEADYLL